MLSKRFENCCRGLDRTVPYPTSAYLEPVPSTTPQPSVSLPGSIPKTRINYDPGEMQTNDNPRFSAKSSTALVWRGYLQKCTFEFIAWRNTNDRYRHSFHSHDIDKTPAR